MRGESTVSTRKKGAFNQIPLLAGFQQSSKTFFDLFTRRQKKKKGEQ